jgi:hypothetical protein
MELRLGIHLRGYSSLSWWTYRRLSSFPGGCAWCRPKSCLRVTAPNAWISSTDARPGLDDRADGIPALKEWPRSGILAGAFLAVISKCCLTTAWSSNYCPKSERREGSVLAGALLFLAVLWRDSNCVPWNWKGQLFRLQICCYWDGWHALLQILWRWT